MQDGRIPAFRSEAEARAEIARRFPLPRGNPITDHSSMEELAGAMEDNYSKMLTFSYDLDAARAWTKAPGPVGLTPRDALDIWGLCWQVDEAPPPQRFDPMGMYAIHENMQRNRDPAAREWYETLLLGMKLTGIVTQSDRRGQPSTWELGVPEMAELWPPTDYVRLATILEKGVAGFARRVSTST